MTTPIDCPDGEYQTQTAQQTCDSCTAGHECSDKTKSPNQCDAGKYAEAKSVNCSVCATGNLIANIANVNKTVLVY